MADSGFVSNRKSEELGRPFALGAQPPDRSRGQAHRALTLFLHSVGDSTGSILLTAAYL